MKTEEEILVVIERIKKIMTRANNVYDKWPAAPTHFQLKKGEIIGAWQDTIDSIANTLFWALGEQDNLVRDTKDHDALTVDMLLDRLEINLTDLEQTLR
jgi:hypothetical protein